MCVCVCVSACVSVYSGAIHAWSQRPIQRCRCLDRLCKYAMRNTKAKYAQHVSQSVCQSVSQLESQSGTQSLRGGGQRAFIFIRLIARVGPWDSYAKGKRATARATATGSDLIVMQSTHKFSIWLTLCALKCSHFTPRVAECRATTICNDLLKWHLHILSHLFANQSGAWAAFSAIRQTRLGQLTNIYDPTTAITIATTTTAAATSSSLRICCCYWLCITLNASNNGNVKDALNLLANIHTHTYTHNIHTHAHSSLWPLSEIITTKSEWVLCCTYRHNPSIY